MNELSERVHDTGCTLLPSTLHSVSGDVNTWLLGGLLPSACLPLPSLFTCLVGTLPACDGNSLVHASPYPSYSHSYFYARNSCCGQRWMWGLGQGGIGSGRLSGLPVLVTILGLEMRLCLEVPGDAPSVPPGQGPPSG